MAAAYAALADRAWRSNQARAAEMTESVGQWRGMGSLSTELSERLRAAAHGVRGSAGTFGHEAAADAAEELEELLVGDAQPRLDVVAELVAQVESALTEPPELS